MELLVSVVIPVYNRESYVEKAILSAVNQTYSNIEIIIGDNCSTDNTWELLKKWSLRDHRIKIFRNDENFGPVLNWNECFKKVSGAYIKILWSDDWMSPDFIEKALNCFDDDVAFVFSGQQITTGEKVLAEISYEKRKYSRRKYLNDILLFGNERFPVSPGCAIFRTKDVITFFVVDIDNDDLLDSKKNGAGNDLLLFLRISLNYEYIATLPTVDSFFRYHKGSFSIDNDLRFYYEWAKIYFVKRCPVSTYLANSLKALFFLRRIRVNKKYNKLYNSLSFTPNFIIEVLFFYFCLVLSRIQKR